MSATTGITDLAREIRRQGKSVISLSIGEPDFEPPVEAIEAAKEAMDKGNTKYSDSNGSMELREAIAKKLREENNVNYSPKQILISTGAKQSLYQAILCITLSGTDEFIIPAPYWVSYVDTVKLAQATVVTIETQENTGFTVQPDELEAAITPQTRALILCNPCNPTGAVYSPAALEALAAVLRRHPHVTVISDEIYEKIVYTDPICSFASLPGMLERTITINGFSKAFAMTGFRLGYMAAPLNVVEACAKLQSRVTSSPNTISQAAALGAFKAPKSYIEKAVAGFREKRDFVIAALNDIPGMTCAAPLGAFYVFPSVAHYLPSRAPSGTLITTSEELVMHLLAGGVGLVHGEAFGRPGCARISYATSMEDLRAGMARLREALALLARVE